MIMSIIMTYYYYMWGWDIAVENGLVARGMGYIASKLVVLDRGHLHAFAEVDGIGYTDESVMISKPK